MGKHVILSTQILKHDYQFATFLLRDYASVIKQQSIFMLKILGKTASSEYKNPRIANIKLARDIAKRFNTRAKRM